MLRGGWGVYRIGVQALLQTYLPMPGLWAEVTREMATLRVLLADLGGGKSNEIAPVVSVILLGLVPNAAPLQQAEGVLPHCMFSYIEWS
jgi:hypothetical protein